MKNPRNLRTFALPVLIIALLAVAVWGTVGGSNEEKKKTYADLYKQVDNGEIKKVEVVGEERKLIVTPKKGEGKPYELGIATEQDVDKLRDRIGLENNVYQPLPVEGNSLVSYFVQVILPFIIFAGLLLFIISQTQGGGSRLMGFGKSRARRVSPDAPKVTFRDVAGADEAVEELEEIRDFLEHPKKFQSLGARIPKGVLLFGPPGTGKTLLARAVAGEAGVPFFSISGSDFVEMFVGVGASRVRDLFEQAKVHSPSIIFIDEIDAVGRHRGAGMGGGNDEREQTLNQLLVEMDGFEMKDNVIMIAATNRPDILDPALLRPGRFDRQVRVDVPDRPGRLHILKVHSKGKPIAKDVDLDKIAGQTPGFTGADLANLVNEAALVAARRGLKKVGTAELEEGIMRVIVGPEKKARLMTDREKKVTAVHEMGHALCSNFLEHADPVHKISVVGRGMALGYVVSMPSEDRFTRRKVELMAQLAQALGGRTAEEIVFGEFTTGAENDLKKVTETAKRMVMKWGMSEKLGPRAFGGDADNPFLGRDFQHEPDYSDELAKNIDEEIYSIINEAHRMATDVLTEHKEELERLAAVLMEHETIDSDQFARLLAGDDVDDVFGGSSTGGSGAASTSDDAAATKDTKPSSGSPKFRPGFGTADSFGIDPDAGRPGAMQ